MLKNKGISILIVILLTLQGISSAQLPDYATIFGSDWQKAEAIERENRHWMEPVLEEHNIPYALAIAVIFPELIRYSALRDRMETTLLKTLYVNLGNEYANFSIGYFQIKPSFAEIIHMEARKAIGKRSGPLFRQPWEYDNPGIYRKSIVADLEDPATEFDYLIAFFKICEKKYRTERMEGDEKIRFLSTAYNYGIDKTREQINNMIGKKFFSTKIVSHTTYSYSDISLYRYKQICGLETPSNEEIP
jgi:hypothetical protein